MEVHEPRSPRGSEVHLERLSGYDCWQLLTHASDADAIARVVWTGPDGPSIVPMNYTVADGFLWFQTTQDSRLGRECVDEQVLVEVDHSDPASQTGWSVVVTGVARFVAPSEDPRVLDLLAWPRGTRELLLRVQPDEITGRRLRGPA